MDHAHIKAGVNVDIKRSDGKTPLSFDAWMYLFKLKILNESINVILLINQFNFFIINLSILVEPMVRWCKFYYGSSLLVQ